MLFNFCDTRLRPEIQCTTISTEGHDVSNLTNNSHKGFLAYACIKPPVNIDINFLCNVSVNHILIWPRVGSQKSSGFQLYAKASNDNSVPYSLLATGYLNSSDNGLLFYPSNINHETISIPPNFLKRYIKPSMGYITMYTSSLRICICKTENSVPALERIEVWGSVSPRCGKDTAASISALWFKERSSEIESVGKSRDKDSPVVNIDDNEVIESSLQVPECYLDSITYELMTQPILLPSGKIIDQSTLLKHEESEALWGRSLTDPFTGLPFSEDRKPVIASALKIRIDKFLLENSNAEEVKKLPRVLGRATPSGLTGKKVEEVPKYLLKRSIIIKSANNTMPKGQSSLAINARENEKLCHKLPVVVVSQKRKASTLTKSTKKAMPANTCTAICKEIESERKQGDCTEMVDLITDDDTDIDINTVVPNLKRFSSVAGRNEPAPKLTRCSCCPNAVFYRLPCKHILCRKVVTSIKNNQCRSCDMPYKNSEIERIYE